MGSGFRVLGLYASRAFKFGMNRVGVLAGLALGSSTPFESMVVQVSVGVTLAND